MDQNALQQITERLKEANNVLVTVSANPSVDQLAACIGFTLLLNHAGKHATAVFSGKVPSTIEFLKPEDTLEKNTDSLRDFIIALDKSKADKLRYKVEDKVVKIFITPYRTSISSKDLEFSQGDFNVDVVMALGVRERTDLDKAIMDHGRILHDATVVSVNNKNQGNLGTINWVNVNASSLSEMIVELAQSLTKDPLDAQMATAFMTGIVAETARFSNNKTSPRTMALAAQLMSAGANQQLIASKLEVSQSGSSSTVTKAESPETPPEAATGDDGSLRIDHEQASKPAEDAKDTPKPSSSDSFGGSSLPTPTVEDITGTNQPDAAPQHDEPSVGMPHRPSMALDPPSLGGQLTANSEPEHLQEDKTTDPLSLSGAPTAGEPPILNRPPNLSGTPIHSDAGPKQGEEVKEAREAVDEAIAAQSPSTASLDPIAALGAQPVDLGLDRDQPPVIENPIAPAPLPEPTPITPVTPTMPSPTLPPAGSTPQPFGAPPAIDGINPNTVTPVPPTILPPGQPTDSTASNLDNPTPPPPVPPPLMPPNNGTNNNSPL